MIKTILLFVGFVGVVGGVSYGDGGTLLVGLICLGAAHVLSSHEKKTGGSRAASSLRNGCKSVIDDLIDDDPFGVKSQKYYFGGTFYDTAQERDNARMAAYMAEKTERRR